jgi:hypothetical protein
MIEKIGAGPAFALALALALWLGGCAGLHPEERLPPPREASGVTLTKEQGGRFIAFVGPRLQHTAPFLGVSDTNYFALRSWLDNKTAELAHQLYVEDSYYGGPYLWDGAQDGDGRPLHFIAIGHNEISCDGGCAYADEFAAELPDDYLRAHQAGFAVTFTAPGGKKLAVTVPPNLVIAELRAVDAVRAIAAKTAANGPTATPPAPNSR